MVNERMPYWDYMRSSSLDLELTTAQMSVMLKDLVERTKRLEEEVAWLRREDTGLATGRGIMD